MADEEPKKGLEFDVGGVKLKLNSMWLAVIIPCLSAAGGALWGGFELYSRYVAMQEKIDSYIAPDLTKYDEGLSVLNERMTSVERMGRSNDQQLKYMSDNIQRNVEQAMRAVDAVDSRSRATDRDMSQTTRILMDQIKANDKDTSDRLKELQKSVDDKIEKTLANPLAGKKGQ
jgi:hypothetical protein